MNNLPITTSPTPAAAPSSNQAAGANDSADGQGSQNSQPFGAVLAKQIQAPAANGTKGGDQNTQASEATAAEIIAQLGTNANGISKITLDKGKDAAAIKPDSGDGKKIGLAVAADGSNPALPADMLAAMLAQAMKSAAHTPASPKSDGTAPSTNAIDDKRNPANIPQTGATISTATAGAQNAAAVKAAGTASLDAQAEVQSFAAAREAATVSADAQQAHTAALASLQNTAVTMAAPSLLPVQATVSTPVNQANWSDEFSQKITWLASSKQDQTAELHLNPPQLGPVDVVLKVSGDQATALFTSPHAAVRDAIEQAMPKLRDMLADNGIMLGNTTVSDQTPRDQWQGDSQRGASAAAGSDLRGPTTAADSTVRVSPIARHNGIVDTFA